MSRTSTRIFENVVAMMAKHNGHLLNAWYPTDATICMAGQSFGHASWFCLTLTNDRTQTDTRNLPTTAFETLAWIGKVHEVWGIPERSGQSTEDIAAFVLISA